jgi:signal transduction histidine kinase
MRKVAAKLGRAFSGLKVRYKLMILHNLFFLVLAVAAWFSLIPLVEREAARALERELSLAREANRPVGDIRDYYEAFTRKAEITLFLVLGGIYVLGVLLLELFVMPVYIYRPLRQLLEADEASRRGDTERELISEELIQGDELGQLMASRNATLRKLRQHEQDLRNALAQLEQVANDLRRKNYLLETAKRNIADQDRLASLGLLSASVAHELNTPLAVLRGSIEKLLETVEDAAAQERLERMLRVTQRLQRLSEGLLDFARVRKQEMEPVALAPLVEEAWTLVAIDEKAASVRFTNETGEGDWVRGNSDRLMQLFVNLLRNALYAVPSGGRIRVSSRREGDFVTVSVEDDGPGIPPDVLPEIFEAFVTTRLDARGTGLGLTVAEGIAHQHGGSITAANRPEGGACLEVRLPAAQPEAARR